MSCKSHDLAIDRGYTKTEREPKEREKKFSTYKKLKWNVYPTVAWKRRMLTFSEFQRKASKEEEVVLGGMREGWHKSSEFSCCAYAYSENRFIGHWMRANRKEESHQVRKQAALVPS